MTRNEVKTSTIKGNLSTISSVLDCFCIGKTSFLTVRYEQIKNGKTWY